MTALFKGQKVTIEFSLWKKNVDQMKEYQAQNLNISLFQYFLSDDQVSIETIKIVLVASRLNCFRGKKC